MYYQFLKKVKKSAFMDMSYKELKQANDELNSKFAQTKKHLRDILQILSHKEKELKKLREKYRFVTNGEEIEVNQEEEKQSDRKLLDFALFMEKQYKLLEDKLRRFSGENKIEKEFLNLKVELKRLKESNQKLCQDVELKESLFNQQEQLNQDEIKLKNQLVLIVSINSKIYSIQQELQVALIDCKDKEQQFQDSLVQVQFQNGRLQANNQDLSTKLIMYEKDLNQIRLQNKNEYDIQIKMIREQVDQDVLGLKKLKVEEHKKIQQQHMEDKKELNRRIAQLTTQNMELKEQMEEIQESLESQKHQLSEQKTQNTKLLNQMQKLVLKENNESLLLAREQELSQCMDELLEVKNKLHSKQLEMGQMRNQLLSQQINRVVQKDSSEQFNRLNQMIIDLNEEMQLKDEIINKLMVQDEEKSQILSQLTLSNQQLKDQYTELNNQYTDLNNQHLELNTQIRELNTQNQVQIYIFQYFIKLLSEKSLILHKNHLQLEQEFNKIELYNQQIVLLLSQEKEIIRPLQEKYDQTNQQLNLAQQGKERVQQENLATIKELATYQKAYSQMEDLINKVQSENISQVLDYQMQLKFYEDTQEISQQTIRELEERVQGVLTQSLNETKQDKKIQELIIQNQQLMETVEQLQMIVNKEQSNSKDNLQEIQQLKNLQQTNQISQKKDMDAVQMSLLQVTKDRDTLLQAHTNQVKETQNQMALIQELEYQLIISEQRQQNATSQKVLVQQVKEKELQDIQDTLLQLSNELQQKTLELTKQNKVIVGLEKTIEQLMQKQRADLQKQKHGLREYSKQILLQIKSMRLFKEQFKQDSCIATTKSQEQHQQLILALIQEIENLKDNLCKKQEQVNLLLRDCNDGKILELQEKLQSAQAEIQQQLIQFQEGSRKVQKNEMQRMKDQQMKDNEIQLLKDQAIFQQQIKQSEIQQLKVYYDKKQQLKDSEILQLKDSGLYQQQLKDQQELISSQEKKQQIQESEIQQLKSLQIQQQLLNEGEIQQLKYSTIQYQKEQQIKELGLESSAIQYCKDLQLKESEIKQLKASFEYQQEKYEGEIQLVKQDKEKYRSYIRGLKQSIFSLLQITKDENQFLRSYIGVSQRETKLNLNLAFTQLQNKIDHLVEQYVAKVEIPQQQTSIFRLEVQVAELQKQLEEERKEKDETLSLEMNDDRPFASRNVSSIDRQDLQDFVDVSEQINEKSQGISHFRQQNQNIPEEARSLHEMNVYKINQMSQLKLFEAFKQLKEENVELKKQNQLSFYSQQLQNQPGMTDGAIIQDLRTENESLKVRLNQMEDITSDMQEQEERFSKKIKELIYKNQRLEQEQDQSDMGGYKKQVQILLNSFIQGLSINAKETEQYFQIVLNFLEFSESDKEKMIKIINDLIRERTKQQSSSKGFFKGLL